MGSVQKKQRGEPGLRTAALEGLAKGERQGKKGRRHSSRNRGEMGAGEREVRSPVGYGTLINTNQ